MRPAYRTLIVAILAGAVLAACKQTPEVEEAVPIEEPVVEVITAPPEPAEPPRVDRDGNPVDVATGRPLGRTFYFEFDQARLSERDLRVLAMHAEYLRDFRNRSVLIEGHCDERGTREYNLALGERRAQAVQQYLSSAGVRSSQIEIVSYGEERPVDTGSTESAYAKNRRAEMVYR